MAKNLEAPTEPPGIYAKKSSTQLFFDQKAKHDTDRAHWKIGFWMMIIVCCVLAGTIYSVMPLKTVKIYRLEIDKVGAQTITPMSAGEYTPSDNEVRARTKEMVERMFGIDIRLMKRNLTKVELMMSGQARKQFNEFLFADKPFQRVASQPDLRRDVQVSGVSKIADRVLLVDFVTKERTGTGDPIVKRRTLTISYEIKPARTDEEVLGDNPAGIYIVSFTLADIN